METKLAFETLFVVQSLDDTQVPAATQVLSKTGMQLHRYSARQVCSKTVTLIYTGTQLDRYTHLHRYSDRYAATQVLS